MMRTRAVGLTLAVGLVAALPAAAAAPASAAETTRLVLPAPTGNDRIGTVSLHLVDRSRADPWVPSTPAREIMAQLWYPARNVRKYSRAPWVSPGVAERVNPPGSGVTLPVTHAHVGAPAKPGRHPVVVYSPGLGVERTASTALVEELASQGFVVVTIDHTHDSSLVEFPGGRIESNAMPEPTDNASEERVIATALATRMADTRFVLDRLAELNRGANPDEERRALPPGLKGAFDLSRVGMFGHSLGGATAAQTMYEDARVIAGINMDGSVSGAVVTGGLDRPFLLMGSDRDGPDSDDNWDALWQQLRGPRLRLQLVGSGHMSFTDYQVLLPQAGVPPEAMQPAFGTIEGRRAVTVQRAYILAYFNRYLRHCDGKLLAGPSRRYPEMRFLP